MATVQCIKCGLTGMSKCPFCRNVFGLGGMRLAMMEACLPFPDYEIPEGSDGAYVKVSYRWFPQDAPRTGSSIDADALMAQAKPDPERRFLQNEAWRLQAMRSLYGLLKMMFELTDDTHQLIEYWNCDHDIQFAPGQTSDIGCGHAWQPKQEDPA